MTFLSAVLWLVGSIVQAIASYSNWKKVDRGAVLKTKRAADDTEDDLLEALRQGVTGEKLDAVAQAHTTAIETYGQAATHAITAWAWIFVGWLVVGFAALAGVISSWPSDWPAIWPR